MTQGARYALAAGLGALAYPAGHLIANALFRRPVLYPHAKPRNT